MLVHCKPCRQRSCLAWLPKDDLDWLGRHGKAGGFNLSTRLKILLSIVGVAILFVALRAFDVPFIRNPLKYIETPWEIAIYEGPSLSELKPRTPTNLPILTKDDVSDAKAEFVADPFWIEAGGKNYLFVEVLNEANDQGDLAVAVSTDGEHWTYEGIVLDEPFHLSYPQVFESEGAYYMIPETGQASQLRLYKAVDVPKKWAFVGKLMDGKFYDPTIFRHDGRWWMFALTDLKGGRLDLFYADALEGPWQKHPANPIVANDKNKARPAGRVIVDGDHLYRVAQDNEPHYGMSVSVFEITELTPEKYSEQPAFPKPILGGDGTWLVEHFIHQLDTKRLPDGRWVALIDRHQAYWQLRWPIGP